MNRILYATPSEPETGMRIKDFLRRRWGISTALLIELKRRDDGICVNGTRVTVNYVLQEGDRVALNVGDNGADSGFEDLDLPLNILYEDSDVIVLNKPPFLAVHPSKGHVNDTLANCLSHYFHQKGETFVSRCVLRLDRNTSGAVLFAKNAYSHDRLRHGLDEGTVEKEYLALVHGEPSPRGAIDAPIGHPDEATVRRIVTEHGKPSITEFETIRSDGELSLLRVIPKTGRTHQIRLHLSHAGFPIVSDFLYGDENDGILSRHGLHCAKISFIHPVTGKTVTVKAPLAPDMEKIAEGLSPAQRYHTLDRHLRTEYGEKLVKLSLDGGMSCPNRKRGSGCTFCSARGSGDFTPSPILPLQEQLKEAKALIAGKWKGYRYIAYFQAYTNTYAPVDYLEDLFTRAIEDPEVAVLSIATRPDCLPDEVLNLLERLNKIKPVWVELGLQTARDDTADALNRGYPLSVYEEATKALRTRGIKVITHLIFGLPGETKEDAVASARYAADHGDGIKIQMLQILKGAKMAEQFEREPFDLLTRDEYVQWVCDALERIPFETVIHRITGDPPAGILIAPKWVTDKKSVVAAIHAELDRRNTTQGHLRQK